LLVILHVILGAHMYEDAILKLLSASKNPLSVSEVKESLAQRFGKKVSYETVKRDLMSLAAKGEIHSKSIGGGRRGSWIFWLPKAVMLEAQGPSHLVDPFDISPEERDSMNPRQLSELYDRVLGECRSVVKRHLKGDSRFIALCGGRIVCSLDHEISDEEVRELERKYSKVCYVITEDLIEETPWIPLGDEDYYPAIEVFLGKTDWETDAVFERGIRVIADFDTGNPDIAAFSDEELASLKTLEPRIMRRAIHLGRYYDYYLLKVKMGICDASGKKRCIERTCRSVLFWREVNRNPFLLANPNRNGFIGRDLLTRFPFNVLLSGKMRNSRVYLT